MESLKIGEIATFCGAKLCGIDPELNVSGISTDSRTICAGELFVALRGENFDGHDYIAKARERGAACVLSSRGNIGSGTLEVEDTLLALQQIAAGYRKKFPVKVTAITGSVGKTTTKEMTAAVLGVKFNTLKTEGNLNNTIGVPLSVLKLGREHEAAVFEMGMNHFGEISQSTRAALPDVAVISNIGTAHIEFLGSREGILRAKLEIAEGLPEDGVLILNGDEPLLWEKKAGLGFRTVYFGIENENSDIRAENIRESTEGSTFDIVCGEGSFSVRVPAAGRHNVMNALAAAAVGREYGMDFDDVARGLDIFENVGMRQRIYTKDGYRIIDDCYNANPESMSAALGVLAEVAEGRKIAVLGDMLELGSYSEQAHRELGRLAAEKADIIFFFGSEVRFSLEEAEKSGGCVAEIYDDRERLTWELMKLAVSGDTVLFKGSRGMKLEEVRKIFCGE